MLVLNKVSEDNASQIDANGRKTVQNKEIEWKRESKTFKIKGN